MSFNSQLSFGVSSALIISGTITNANISPSAGISTSKISGLATSATTDTTNATNISSGALAASRMPAFTGDITTSAGAIATTLATVNSNVGTFGSSTLVPVITVNAKGLVTGVTTSSISGALTFTGDVTGSGTTGSNTALSITALAVTNAMLAGSITNAKLSNSNITVGTTAIALGASSTTLAGLTSVTSTGFTGALTGNASTATTLETARAIQGVNFDGSAAITVVTAGTGVSVSGTAVSIGQAVGTTDNVTFNNVTVSGTLTSDDITSTNISVAGNATITGDLTVSGTTTTINSTTIAIADLNLELARNATTAAAANGAGITVTGPVTPATFTYTSADDRWNLNKNLNVTTVFGALSGNASTATALATGRTIAVTGDITYTSGSFDGTGNVTGAATLATVNANVGAFGSSTLVPVITVNAKGLVTAVSTASISGSISVTGGDLTLSGTTGTAITNATLATVNANVGTFTKLTVNAKGLVTAASAATTTDIGEGTNLYYTDTRARAAHSFTAGSGAYNSSTGVITIPTNNNQLTNGAGYITGYTETDTLATVTGRGATTTIASTFNGGITVKDSMSASTTNAGGNFNLFSNLTGFQSLTIAGGNLITGTDKYVYVGTGTNHASSTTTVEISSSTSGSLTKVWSPLTVVGTITGSNLSGTNTGDNAGVTSVAGVTPIVSSGGTTPSISHAASGATAGTYNNVTVNTFGHVTAGSNTSYLTAEADTLATVTARGATTSTALTLSGNVNMSGSGLFLNRNASTTHGISWYASNYTSWSTYMAAGGATSVGPTANITAPSGTLVNSWALRNFVENAAGYGFTWESGTATGQPTVIAEIRSSDGAMRIAGAFTAVGTITGSNLSGTNTGDNAGVTSVSGTAPVVSSGGTTPAISMAAATASVNGYMTSTYASKLDGIAAGATNVTNTNQLTNGAGYITSSGTATNLYGAGGSYIASSNSGTGYGSAIQVREAGLGGAQGSAIAYAPRLGFHWGGVVASSIVMEASGRIGIVNNPGTSYEAFVCGTLTASNITSAGDVIIGQSAISYSVSDNTAVVGSIATNKLHVNGSIQLTGNNDAIVFGSGTSTFLKDEELGFGWGGGWYMTDSSYLRVRGSKILYNDYIIRSDTDMRAPIFYDQNDTSYYGDFASTSRFNLAKVNGVYDSSITRGVIPSGAVYTTSASAPTGAFKIKLPDGSRLLYPMLSFTVELYNYSTGTSRSFRIGGHFSGASWYSVFAYCLTDYAGSVDVRFGYDAANAMCVWIGEVGSTWSYPQVFVTDFQNGYNAIQESWFSGWSITLVTAFDTVTNGPYTPAMGLNSKNYTSYAMPIGSSATNTVDIRAPIFYDSNNTGFYGDFASTSNMNVITSNTHNVNNGNSFVAQGYNNNGGFAMNNSSTYWGLMWNYAANDWRLGYGSTIAQQDWCMRWDNGGTAWSNSSHRAPIFYDSNDTTYYVDPNSRSNLYNLTLANSNEFLVLGNADVSTTNKVGLSWGGGTNINYSIFKPSGAWIQPLYIAFHTGLKIGAQSGYGGTRFYNTELMATEILSVGNGDDHVRVAQIGYAGASFRAPIFYDQDDTGYYTSPNSFSQMSYGNFNAAPSGRTLSLGGDQTDRVYNDAARSSLVINASYYPHLYINATGGGNTTHGPVFSMTGNLSAGGFRRWGMGIANLDPDCWSWGYYDNNSNPHYSVGGNFGYTGTNSKMWLNTGGSLMTTGDMRAPIFYDSDNTAYYGDFAGNSRHLRLNLSSAQPDGTVGRLRVSSSTNGASEINGDTYAIMLGPSSTRTGAGYYYAGIAINGLMNYAGGTSYDTAAHIWLGAYYRDTPGSERSDFIVAVKSGTGNTGTGSDLPQVRFRVDYDGIASATGSLRAPIFYDSDNTGYYVDPASTSNFVQINLQGILRRNTSAAGYLEGNYPTSTDSNSSAAIYTIGGSYQPTSTTLGNMYGVGYTAGTGTANPGLGQTGWGFYVAGNGTSRIFLDGEYGVGIASASFRAPIFYDSNNTGYYVDPNGTSVVNTMQFNGNIRRGNHSSGFLEGSYNNIGANSTNSSPIYTIGSSYNPTDSALASMYGVGYSHPNFWGSGKGGDWGFYVAANGAILGNFGCASGVNTWISGYGEATGSWRAPIFYDSNNTAFYLDPNSTGTSLNVAGAIIAAGNVTAYSDIRLKEDIEVITNAIDKVKQITGITYTRKENGKRQTGVIAQDVLKVLPEAVEGSNDSMYSVAYGNMVGLLVEAIKEQQIQIEELKTEMKAMKNKSSL